MLINNRKEEITTSMSRQTANKAVSGPDPSWGGLYKVGGITAILYVVLGLIAPGIQIWTSQYDFYMHGADLLDFIASNRLWWLILQTLVLGFSFLAIISFAALFAALKHLNKSYAAIGALIGGVAQLLFMAYYPVLLGLTYLSDQYIAANATQKAVFITASEALLAMNNAINPLYECVFAAGILIISLVMLKGVFPKSIAYLGIVTSITAFIAVAAAPIIGIAYFWWWLFFVIWFVAIGWKLYRLGGVQLSA